MKVIVYLRAEDERRLREEGKDPAQWVRSAVKFMLKRKEGEWESTTTSSSA